MNIFMVGVSIAFFLFLIWVVPMFAEMAVFFGGVIFLLGIIGESNFKDIAMWVGLIISLCSIGVVYIKKKNKID